MLRGVSESSRRHSQALSYIPDTGTLLAGGNREYRLDNLLAEGGEGKVYEVKGQSEVVAKVYKSLDLSRKDKLKTMVDRSTRGLRKVCAWPLSPLSDSTDETVGFVMESLVGWEPLHNAYQIRSRLNLFPQQTYTFLVRAARNLATCVHHLHEEGIVVGDLNESNVFVNGKALVKLIDADSFQIMGPTALYPCKVGKPELMPPELQGHSLEGIVRSPEHDRFALAVLIFQTLVFGRHPFAGTTDDHHDLPLESCIEHGFYAFTTRRQTPVKPPPYLDLTWLPEDVRELFEEAFDPSPRERPTAKAWYFALKNLETSLRTCPENPSHMHWNGAGACPWCRLEDCWRIALFRPALTDPDQEYEVGEILAKLQTISIPAESGRDLVDFDYKDLPAAHLGPWQSFFGRAAKHWGWFIFCFFQIINLASDHRFAYTVLFVGVVAVLLFFGILFSQSEHKVKAATKKLGGIAEVWKEEADPRIFEEELQRYQDLAKDLGDVKSRFDRRREEYVRQLHTPELNNYLSKTSIEIADAFPLDHKKLGDLANYGIRTAAEITDERFNAVPRLIPAKEKDALKVWRRTLEQKFWSTHNYKLTIHQERKLILEVRKENDLRRQELESAPQVLEALAERLRDRQAELAGEAEKQVGVLRNHGPKLLALEGKQSA